MSSDEVTWDEIKVVLTYILVTLNVLKIVLSLAFVAGVVIILTGAMPYSDTPSMYLDY